MKGRDLKFGIRDWWRAGMTGFGIGDSEEQAAFRVRDSAASDESRFPNSESRFLRSKK
jgi:hypothetical protein